VGVELSDEPDPLVELLVVVPFVEAVPFVVELDDEPS